MKKIGVDSSGLFETPVWSLTGKGRTILSVPPTVIVAVLAFALLASAGCPKRTGPDYDFDPPPSVWAPKRGSDGQLLFQREAGEMGIMVNTLCDRYHQAPLKPVARDLFIGFEDKEVIKDGETQVSGLDAHYMIMTAKFDGAPLKMKSYTFRKGECIYDLVYFSPPAGYEAGLGDFETFVESFKAR